MAAWTPTDHQMNFEVYPVYEDCKEQLRELQQTIGCPDSAILSLLGCLAGHWGGSVQMPPKTGTEAQAESPEEVA